MKHLLKYSYQDLELSKSIQLPFIDLLANYIFVYSANDSCDKRRKVDDLL